MKHCGNETCRGHVCDNWTTCKGETIPPWNFDQRHETTAEVSTREQDILAAADAMADAIEQDFVYAGLYERMKAYRKARYGKKDVS